MSFCRRGQWLLTAAVAGVVAGSVQQAMGVAVAADPLSFEPQHRSDTGIYLESRAQVTASGLRIGTQSGFGNAASIGGIDGVFFFKLPSLAAGETVLASSLSFSSLRDSATAGAAPNFNADLYAMGFEKNPAPHSAPIDAGSTGVQSNYAQSLFFVGPTQTGTGLNGAPIQKIQDNILTAAEWIPFSAGAGVNAPRSTSAQANADLGTYIQNNLYGNGDFQSNNDFLLLRLNPDATAYTGAATQRYQVSTNQTSTSTYTGLVTPRLDMIVGSSWNKNDSVSVWSDSGSWLGTVPNATDRGAVFGAIITGAQTVNVDGAKTAAQLVFNNLNSYNVAGSAITLSSLVNPPTVTVQAGSHTVAAPLILGGNTTFNIAASSALTASDLTSTGTAITKTGAGTLSVNNVRSNTVNVGAGTLKTLPIANLMLNTSVSAATSNVTSLTVDATSKLNLTNSRIVTNDPQGTKTGVTYSGILGLVQTGRNGGAWNGNGIITDQADALANKTSIGVATAAESKGLTGGATTMWSGQTIDANDTLVMYTYAGDANLDGAITADDYASIDLYFLAGGQGTWYRGDFNYDGSITADDYALIDSGFIANYTPLWVKDGPRGTAGLSAVPEPASLSVLAIGGIGLMARRRRSR